MALTKEKKKELIAGIVKAVTGSKSVVFANFHGVNVADEQSMRRALKKEGVGYAVVRKTLAKRALAEANVAGDMPEFKEELAIVYGDDLTAPAREFYVFQKKYENRVKIVGGIFEGKYMSVAEMTAIAAIPSQKTLYAQFVNLINSPIQRFAVVLDQIANTKTA
ncbi:MAG: 50S ribosomal protein L10 [Patescibacteria group bacterium]|nr:50S ribosomal protein L10 [Patescibacteria group bacterium]MDE1945661.1 50S ribosomal protein L10 [Patescibacteria group bacterium]